MKGEVAAGGCACKTSSTFSRMKRMRCGFILCKRANSPRSSHHSVDRREKWDTSASLTVEIGGGAGGGGAGACDSSPRGRCPAG
jgi:hypothetical protein